MSKLQQGTGYHIDADPLDIFKLSEKTRWRPFQALIALSDQAEGDSSLEVVPGFLHACEPWYTLTWDGEAKKIGEWVYSVKVDREVDAPIISLFQVAQRIPKDWKPEGLTEIPELETEKEIIDWLKNCSQELASCQKQRPLKAGDYVLWDPRMAHANGARNTSSTIRRCMYHAYVPAVPEHFSLYNRIRLCRENGLLGLETRTGYSDPNYSPYPVEEGSLAEKLLGFSLWEKPPEEKRKWISERELSFFIRYGFVIIESVFSEEEIAELNQATEQFIFEQTEIDIKKPKGDLIQSNWHKVGDSFGGMLQLQWLAEMEKIRLDERPYQITRELIEATWETKRGIFWHPFSSLLSYALWVYPDRQNFRWPDNILEQK